MVVRRQFLQLLNEVNEYQGIDDTDIATWLHAPASADEILEENEIIQVIQEEHGDKIDSETVESAGKNSNVTFEEAKQSLNQLIEYCLNSPHYPLEASQWLLRIQEYMRVEGMMPPAGPSKS